MARKVKTPKRKYPARRTQSQPRELMIKAMKGKNPSHLGTCC